MIFCYCCLLPVVKMCECICYLCHNFCPIVETETMVTLAFFRNKFLFFPSFFIGNIHFCCCGLVLLTLLELFCKNILLGYGHTCHLFTFFFVPSPSARFLIFACNLTGTVISLALLVWFFFVIFDATEYGREFLIFLFILSWLFYPLVTH